MDERAMYAALKTIRQRVADAEPEDVDDEFLSQIWDLTFCPIKGATT